jgi:hypothetical protein
MGLVQMGATLTTCLFPIYSFRLAPVDFAKEPTSFTIKHVMINALMALNRLQAQDASRLFVLTDPISHRIMSVLNVPREVIFLFVPTPAINLSTCRGRNAIQSVTHLCFNHISTASAYALMDITT